MTSLINQVCALDNVVIQFGAINVLKFFSILFQIKLFEVLYDFEGRNDEEVIYF